jgi:drug/metabolite transporter (DMT)-like permease
MLSYENLPASITTMFDGGNTIGVFLLSIFFLKNKHSKYNFIGVLLLIIGLFFISLSAINDDKKEKESTKYFSI